MIRVSIVGGSGYAGGELLRLLLLHPQVEVGQVTSRQWMGESVTLHHPNLRGYTDLRYSPLEKLEKCDLLFFALPNGISMQILPALLERAPRLIDLGADFRLRDPESWAEWYRIPHQASELLGRFVYGLPELHREQISRARWVANPGCEATVSILSLWPLFLHQVVEEPVIIDAKMSSSQAGRQPSESSHHPERAGVVRSYKPAGHRHTAEIEQELSREGRTLSVAVSATALELVRGLMVTIHARLRQGKGEKEVWQAFRAEYSSEPFIRLVTLKSGLYRFPEPKILSGTNFCDIGFALDRRANRLVIIGAIDNLVKGTAGNAVQCMNIIFGFSEKEGLDFPGLHPI